MPLGLVRHVSKLDLQTGIDRQARRMCLTAAHKLPLDRTTSLVVRRRGGGSIQAE